MKNGKNLLIIILFLLLLGTAVALALLSGRVKPPQERKEDKKTEQQKPKPAKKDIKTEVIAKDLQIPWSIAFLPDNSAVFTERNGLLRSLDSKGKLVKTPVAEIPVSAEGEGGLLGVTVHPDFEKNNFIYLYYTYKKGSSTLNKVEGYRLAGKKLADKKVIIDEIPGGVVHNGGRIKFGPDNKLYITTGDAQKPDSAQDIDSTAGKILRVNDDGGIPENNPFSGNPVYSYGHRNVQGIAWHPETQQLFATEHGPDANDEVNRIVKGGNYGWPEVKGTSKSDKFINPILSSGKDTWAPSGADFYKGPAVKFKDNLFFAALRGTHLQRIAISPDDKVTSDEELLKNKFGRLRDVVFGPDNAIYLLTSNRDGRGIPVPSDDRIIKVTFSFD